MRIVAVLFLVSGAFAQEPQQKQMFVLGKKQLIDYVAFRDKHRGDARSALRKQTIADLKKLAEEERPKILKALGDRVDFRPLWIVSGVVISLTKEQVETAKKSDAILWIYPAGRVGPLRSRGRVNALVEQVKREPFTAKGKVIPWNLEMLGVPGAWKAGATGKGIVVAMFDAGVDYTHSDLRGNIWVNPNEIANNGKDDDGNGLIDDLYGYDFARGTPQIRPTRIKHGTLTSAVVAGDGTGGTQTGVAPRAKLMPIIAMGGPYTAARAFEYALSNGADVVNMSFSIPNLGDTRGLWRRIADHATCAGMLLISGAGNFPNVPLPKQIRIPEGIPSVLCVGGVTREKKFATFTSQGPVEWKSVRFYGESEKLIKPDVVAFPGPGIALVHPSGKGYLPLSNRNRGNSLSAPHVAGIAALVWSMDREMTPWRVREILEKSAEDLPPKGKDTKTGFGLVNAERAIRLLKVR